MYLVSEPSVQALIFRSKYRTKKERNKPKAAGKLTKSNRTLYFKINKDIINP